MRKQPVDGGRVERGVRFATLVVLALGHVGCDSSSIPDDLVGTYHVTQVDSRNVPTTITKANGSLRFDAGELIIKEGNTFTLSIRGRYEDTSGSGFNFDVGSTGGSFSRSGNTITFTDMDTSPTGFTAAVRSDDLEFVYPVAAVNFTLRVAP